MDIPSILGRKVTDELWKAKEQTGKSISQILREAVAMWLAAHSPVDPPSEES